MLFVARITHRDVVSVLVIHHQYVRVAATGFLWESTCEIRVDLTCLDTEDWIISIMDRDRLCGPDMLVLLLQVALHDGIQLGHHNFFQPTLLLATLLQYDMSVNSSTSQYL
jgi:hypothetical protein